MDRFLKKGDIFCVKEGMCVTTKIPEKFIYSHKALSRKLCACDIKIGKILKAFTPPPLEELADRLEDCLYSLTGTRTYSDLLFEALKFSLPLPTTDILNTLDFCGTYRVTKTEMYTKLLPSDSADPTTIAFKVFAEKIQCEESKEIWFYQCGPTELLESSFIKPEDVELIEQ